MDLEADPIPVEEIVKGSEQLKYYCPKYTYPLLAYLGPVYASGREQLSDDEFESKIEEIINDNVPFYWVPTENYVLKDYVFKPNKIEMEDFLIKKDYVRKEDFISLKDLIEGGL